MVKIPDIHHFPQIFLENLENLRKKGVCQVFSPEMYNTKKGN